MDDIVVIVSWVVVGTIIVIEEPGEVEVVVVVVVKSSVNKESVLIVNRVCTGSGTGLGGNGIVCVFLTLGGLEIGV